MRYAILASIALVLGGCSAGLSSKPFVDTKSFIEVGGVPPDVDPFGAAYL